MRRATRRPPAWQVMGVIALTLATLAAWAIVGVSLLGQRAAGERQAAVQQVADQALAINFLQGFCTVTTALGVDRCERYALASLGERPERVAGVVDCLTRLGNPYLRPTDFRACLENAGLPLPG